MKAGTEASKETVLGRAVLLRARQAPGNTRGSWRLSRVYTGTEHRCQSNIESVQDHEPRID